MAKVTRRFPGVRDGETVTRWFEVGEEVDGDLARVAVANGWAEEPRAAETKAPEPKEDGPRRKAKKGR